jgi:hypothetical protein
MFLRRLDIENVRSIQAVGLTQEALDALRDARATHAAVARFFART